MNSKEYWAQREAEALKGYIKDEEEYARHIQKIYSDMLDSCNEQINAFYGKYAASEGITIAEAKKRVSALDIAAYERKAKRYVKDKDFSDKANEEMRLYNATMKINWLEMLKANIGLEMIAGHNELEKFMDGILKSRTEDELKRQAGILGKTVKTNSKKVHAIPNASFHNATFSDRIWLHQDLMKAELSKLLQSGLIQGKNPRVLARELKKQFDVKTADAERLMRTELARVQTEAQKAEYERNGFEEYIFLANSSCCEVCQALHDRHFKVAEMTPGENASPIHTNCRCSTAPYSDRKEYDEWLEHLANGGTTEEWNRLKKSGKTLEKFAEENIIEAKTVDDAIKFAQDTLKLEQTTAYNLGMNVEVANSINKAIFDIGNKFGSLTESEYLENVLLNTKRDSAYASYSPALRSMFINKAATQKNAVKKMKETSEKNYNVGFWSTNSAMHSVYHELGHAVEHMICNNDAVKNNKISVLYKRMYNKVLGKDHTWTTDFDVAIEQGKKAQGIGFSYYGFRNQKEFVAEAIAQYYLSDNPGDIANEVVKVLTGG